jgi:hypothetical protein
MRVDWRNDKTYTDLEVLYLSSEVKQIKRNCKTIIMRLANRGLAKRIEKHCKTQENILHL